MSPKKPSAAVTTGRTSTKNNPPPRSTSEQNADVTEYSSDTEFCEAPFTEPSSTATEETTSSLLLKAIERSKQAIEGAESVLEDDAVKKN